MTVQKLPQKARVELTPPRLSDGLVGLVEAVHAAFAHSYGQVLPEHLRLDEMLAVSGVAFRQYVYEREYNRLENPKPFSKLGEFVCNYGPFESLGYYTGWEVESFNEISQDDAWKLARVEIAAGRPVVSLDTTDAVRPMLVVGYRDEPRERVLEVVRAGESRTEEFDVTTRRDLQKEEASFVNWLVIARPAESAEWTAPRTRQRLRALRWAVTHAGRHKEFSQEMRENYAPGLRGFESFLDLLDRASDDDEAFDEADADFADYVAAHVDGLRRARRAASKRLGAWSADFIAEFDLDDEEAVESSLEAAADAYEQLADRLDEWRESWNGEALSGDDLDTLWQRYSQAASREEEANDALKVAVKVLPKGY